MRGPIWEGCTRRGPEWLWECGPSRRAISCGEEWGLGPFDLKTSKEFQGHEIPTDQSVTWTLLKLMKELGGFGGWEEPHLRVLLREIAPPKATVEGDTFRLCLNRGQARTGPQMGT